MRTWRNIISLFSLSAFAALLSACSNTPRLSGGAVPNADTACAKGSAQISIGDGFQEILCGCNELGGQVVGAGTTPVTCTVPQGTEIFFYYLATRLKHQVIPSDGVSFPASGLSDPSAKIVLSVHAFQLNTAGTFHYLDAYDSGVFGQLVVQ